MAQIYKLGDEDLHIYAGDKSVATIKGKQLTALLAHCESAYKTLKAVDGTTYGSFEKVADSGIISVRFK